MCGIAVYCGSSEQRKQQLAQEFRRISYRGPDNTVVKDFGPNGWMGFHRLKIMDLSDAGNQPLSYNNIHVVCNGEIYNYKELTNIYQHSYHFHSHSDCEALLPLFIDRGIVGMAQSLDAEFACVIYDEAKRRFYAARDPIGIRPLFYGYDTEGDIYFASEVKSLHSICKTVAPFPPGHCYDGQNFIQYTDIARVETYNNDEQEAIFENINRLLIKAVKKRMNADAPVGFLCSGGLDSSLVCAIAAKLSPRPIKTFAVGIVDGPIDTKYARIVADYLKSEHHEYLFTKKDIFDTLSELIYTTETWDITTIRASLGMYLICKYVRENTDVKVLLTGEISDELFGYKYTDFAPGPEEFQKESEKRIRELYMYDVLRADRCISSHGLEARVPFGDIDFVKYVMAIRPEKKMNFTGIGKYLLRKAFEGEYLPHEILYREKAAFSDAVGHSVVDYLKAYAEETYSDSDLKDAALKYRFATPISKESLLYRDIFESHFPGRAQLIKDFWMPNKEWENCNVNDPSARVLPNYGKSGE
jgi:asparagine synthase (glutamine-hydrolysing)